MTWYAGTCGINDHGLTIQTSYYGQLCVLYRGFGFTGFMTKVQPFSIDGHYRTDVINGVGHPRSDSVVLLVLRTIVYNGWGISIVLRVPRDSANPAEKG